MVFGHKKLSRFLGLFLILPILNKTLRCEDPLIAVIGAISTMFGFLLMAIGQKDWTGPNGKWDPSWVMFVSAAFQLNHVVLVSLISQVTKIFESSETGQILSIVSLVTCLVPLISSPMFGGIYKATLDTYEGTYLFAVVALFSFIVGSNLYMLLRVKNKEYEKIQCSEEEKNKKTEAK